MRINRVIRNHDQSINESKINRKPEDRLSGIRIKLSTDISYKIVWMLDGYTKGAVYIDIP